MSDNVASNLYALPSKVVVMIAVSEKLKSASNLAYSPPNVSSNF